MSQALPSSIERLELPRLVGLRSRRGFVPRFDLIAETLGAADSLEALSARLSLQAAEYQLGELIRLQTCLEVIADHGTSVLPRESAASASDGIVVTINERERPTLVALSASCDMPRWSDFETPVAD